MRRATPMTASPSPLRLSRRRALANLGGGAALAALSPLLSCTRGGGPGESGSDRIRVRERESGAPGLELILGRSNEIFPRHSEGDLVHLPDGRLLAVWSRFSGASDHAESQIVGRYSEDMGHSWGPIHPVASLSEPEHTANSNLMSASLLRLSGSGEIHLFYMGKEETEPENKAFHRKIRSSIHTRVSRDGVTFSKPVRLSDRDHYYVTNNARALQLSTGRILVPRPSPWTRGRNWAGRSSRPWRTTRTTGGRPGPGESPAPCGSRTIPATSTGRSRFRNRDWWS